MIELHTLTDRHVLAALYYYKRDLLCKACSTPHNIDQGLYTNKVVTLAKQIEEIYEKYADLAIQDGIPIIRM